MCSDIFFNFLRAEFKEIRKVKIILLVATDRLLIFLDHSAGASYGLLTERQEVLEIEADFWLFEWFFETPTAYVSFCFDHWACRSFGLLTELKEFSEI